MRIALSSQLSNQYSALRRSAGQALVEYAIVFPIQLIITLAIIQLAHIFIARQVLDYAAFCAARARLVGLGLAESRRAALIPISAIAGADGIEAASYDLPVPGWETLMPNRTRSVAAADVKTPIQTFAVYETLSNGHPVDKVS